MKVRLFFITLISILILFLSMDGLLRGGHSQAQTQDRGQSVKNTSQVRKKIALVIGNSSYTESPLKNPVNDAKDMAQTLKELGFSVELQLNANREKMLEAIEKFGEKIEENCVVLFYFAGHGVQSNGQNYLIPVDAEITKEGQLKFKAVEADTILGEIESSKNTINLIILDACRNNPFARSFRSTNSGLAQMNASKGTLIAYSTAPGKTASDGNGRNGLYTQELLKWMKKPGLKVEDVFKNVRKSVLELSNQAQLPWDASSLVGEFSFVNDTASTFSFQPQANNNSYNKEKEFWDDVKNSKDPVEIQAYLKKYPDGEYVDIAKARIEKLKSSLSSDIDNKLTANTTTSPNLTSNKKDVKLGTILKFSMDTYLTSRTAEIGDPFTATVFEDVKVNGEIAIPSGAKIEGKVSVIKRAERKSKSGILGIDFERLRLPNGQIVNVEGQLASLDVLEQKQIDEEKRVAGASKLIVVFIGGGAVGAAATGAIAVGSSTATGILGSIFAKGVEAEVMSGQKFGLELLRSLTIEDAYKNSVNNQQLNDRLYNRGKRENSGSLSRYAADLKSTALVRRAQKSLLDLNYYNGTINGINGPSTRTAVRAFQRDYDLQQTGDLDLDTAYQLGLINEDGVEIMPVRIINVTAEKQGGTIKVRTTVEAKSGGWQMYTSIQVNGNQLHVYVTGTPPHDNQTQTLTRYPVDVAPVRENGSITKVIVHGDGSPLAVSFEKP